ncbi:hypothetical protein LSH36_81g01000, partial [Paralvinella palmiformis]
PQLNNCLIPSRDLDLGPRLGGGLFGDTYIADWKERTVAAKRITVGIHQNQLTDESYHWLMAEVKMMRKPSAKVTHFGLKPCNISPYIQITEGLHFLHSGKPRILHRDFRCANIIIDKYNRAKIVDFGMTKLIQRLRQRCDGRKGCFCNKHLNALPASVRWTAPEILQHPQSDENSDVITKACDVYSFAVVMWEMATLCDPFDDISDENEVMQLVIAGTRPRLGKLNGMIEPLKDLMILCWDPNPQKRPSTKQILSQLKSCVQMLTKT